ncbi:hypothetical protein, partial [Lacticaseibacillus rhamnosus]|uniref:hypothetical protein n=1 Tax=Lacticaseibacillus rhamnosus TaxID=47715 RepID=UPI00194F8B60
MGNPTHVFSAQAIAHLVEMRDTGPQLIGTISAGLRALLCREQLAVRVRTRAANGRMYRHLQITDA